MTTLTSTVQSKKVEGVGRETAVSTRRHDVDWLRTIALGLLIIYHASISFQPWGSLIGFPQNKDTLETMWLLMGLISVWRIPILFVISGMGVRFAMERRDWKQLLKDRTVRILIPFVFGIFTIVPSFIYIILKFYNLPPEYKVEPGHLWFLANIFVYVLLLMPIFYFLKNRPDNILFKGLAKMLNWPVLIILVALPLMLEAWLVNPEIYSTYAMTAHGFWMGLICFATGFLFISLKDTFWHAVEQSRWFTLLIAFSLYLVRFLVYMFEGAPNWMTALESMSWILAIIGFGSLHLNKPSKSLRYLNKAVYPVYIIHMPVLFVLMYLVLPLRLSPWTKFALMVAGTFVICLLLYEFILKRIKWLRPLFGMKI